VRKNTCCSSDPQEGGQPFPKTGPLSKRLDLQELRSTLSGSKEETVYAYVVDSIVRSKVDDKFIQCGSGPNFQGGLITLCTCKRWMRTFRTPEEWKGTWIAGLCSVNAANGQQALFYLMRVEEACESHRDLWAALRHDVQVAKTARTHCLGDVYEPRLQRDPFDPTSYHLPAKNHSHRSDRWPDEWREDINYVGKKRRRAALLVGDPNRSYLWDWPQLIYSGKLTQGQKKFTLGDLLMQLSTRNPLS
jgi:hypothetical protein